MKKILALLAFIVSCTALSVGQAGTTVVTAHVTDSTGGVYVNCQWSVVFVGENTVPGAGPYAPAAYLNGQQGNCDSQGNIGPINLADNLNTVTPVPSQWAFSICSASGYTGGPYCKANMLVTITGATQDLSSFFSPIMPLLPTSGTLNLASPPIIGNVAPNVIYSCNNNTVMVVSNLCAGFWGSSDFGVMYNAAAAALPSGGGRIQVSAGTYTWATPITAIASKPITAQCESGSADNTPSNAATKLVYSGTGTAWNVAGSNGSQILGCTLVGPGRAGSTIGILWGRGPGTTSNIQSNMALNDISGFGVGLQFGSFAYIDTFFNNHIHNNGMELYAPSGLSQFGENLAFIGGSFDDDTSTYSTSCIKINSDASIKFFGVSFDQCGFTVDTTNAVIDIHSSHFEAPVAATALDYFTVGPNCQKCQVNFFGGDFYEGNASARTDFIQQQAITNGNGNSINVEGTAFTAAEANVAILTSNGSAICCQRGYLHAYLPNANIASPPYTGTWLNVEVDYADTYNTNIINANLGFKFLGNAPLNHCLVGNGTYYVDSAVCGGGGGGGATIQTNGVNNVLQTTLNFQTSTTNAVGLTNTPVYHTGGAEQFEITGTSFTGNSATATALASTPTNCGAGSAAIGILANGNATGCFSPSGLSGLTQYGQLYAATPTTATTTGPGLIGQVPVSQGSSGAPVMAGPGIVARTVITGSPTDAILCDSGTATLDRGKVIVDANGSTLTQTIPDAGTSGCGGNFVFAIDVSPNNVSGTSYTASTTVTVNNTSTSLFYITDGKNVTSGASTFTLTTGQWALIISPDNVNWLVRKSVPNNTVTGTGTSPNLTAWSGAGTLTNATMHNVAYPRECLDTSASPSTQSCSTQNAIPLVNGDEILYETTTTNTGSLTTAFNGGSAVTWKKWSSGSLVNLVANDIKANEPTIGLYDGTVMINIGPANTSGGGGSSALSAITAATGANTIANVTNQQNWNWALTGATGLGMSFGETSAATSGTAGVQAVLNASTALGSTASPFTITQGTVNGTTNIPALNMTSTWSNSALSGTALQLNVTNTSSATGSCLAQFFSGSSGTTAEQCFDSQGDIRILGGFGGIANTTNVEISGGFGGTNLAGTSGGLLVKGSDNANSGASAVAGYLIMVAGGLTASTPNASALEGLLEVGIQGVKSGTIAAAYDLVCQTATIATYTDCGTTAVYISGVATSTTNPIGIITTGQVPVKLDNTATNGHIVCSSITTGGQGHDNGTASCQYPAVFIGTVAGVAGTVTVYQAGQTTTTQVLSTSIPLVNLDISPSTNSFASSIVIGTSPTLAGSPTAGLIGWTEGTGPTAQSSTEFLWADSTNHDLTENANGGVSKLVASSIGYNSGSRSSSLGSTNVASSANFPTGQYILSCDVVVTAVGTSPTLATTIGWTDISGTARTKTCTTGVVTISDNPVTQTITSNGSAAITVTQTLAISTATWQTTVAITRLQ